MLFYSFFKSLVGKDIVVELKNDLNIAGTLHSVDQFLNFKLTDITVLDTQVSSSLYRLPPYLFYFLSLSLTSSGFFPDICHRNFHTCWVLRIALFVDQSFAMFNFPLMTSMLHSSKMQREKRPASECRVSMKSESRKTGWMRVNWVKELLPCQSAIKNRSLIEFPCSRKELKVKHSTIHILM